MAKLAEAALDERKIEVVLTTAALSRLLSIGKSASDAVDLLLYVRGDEMPRLRRRRWDARVAICKGGK
jgi:hypothetical protein